MKIISISGLDGSGKSTQIKLLQAYLENQGKKVFYFHAIQFGIANKLAGMSANVQLNKEQVRKEFQKSVAKSNKLGIILRKMLLPVDIYRFKDLAKKLEKEKYDYILTDRYFYDSIVNIEFLENQCHSERSEAKSRNLIRSLDYVSRRHSARDDIKKPEVAIYLETNPEIIMQRERKPDQGIEYLRKKKKIFDKYADIWNLKIIDGSKTQEEVFEEIKNLL